MVNKIILAVLFFPLLCSAQSELPARLTDKSVSAYQLNLNTSIDGGVSLSGTYSFTEGIKALFGADYYGGSSYYHFAPSAGIMLITDEESTAPYLKVQAGPNFSFARGASPGVFFNSALGLQYLLTNSIGVNFELYYRHVKYSREKILVAEVNDLEQGLQYIYSGTRYNKEELGLAFGLNYRFGGSKKNPDKDFSKQNQKTFLERVSINAGISLNSVVRTKDAGGFSPGYNIFGAYALNDNFQVGTGVEYTDDKIHKYYSTYITGIAQTSAEKLPVYARFSAGSNFFSEKNLSPAPMFSLAAGVKYNISGRFGINLEAALKNLHYRINTPQTYVFEEFRVTEYETGLSGRSMLGLSLGANIRLAE
jgi:hypothetical protein